MDKSVEERLDELEKDAGIAKMALDIMAEVLDKVCKRVFAELFRQQDEQKDDLDGDWLIEVDEEKMN